MRVSTTMKGVMAESSASRETVRPWVRGVGALLAAWTLGCSEGTSPRRVNPDPRSGLFVAAAASRPAGVAPVYVSLPSGAIPSGGGARLRVERTGNGAVTQIIAGGFDPVAMIASVGDTVAIEVSASNAETIETFLLVVPRSTRPVIVRTSPQSNKRDVPLNSTIMLVFSEPIDPLTLTSANVQLRSGGVLVNSVVAFVDSAQLIAQLVPGALLSAATDYEVIIGQGIRDLDGMSLGSSTVITFTTGLEPPPSQLVFDSVTAGRNHVCGITTSGAAYCWGDNTYGQLGTGSTTGSRTPLKVSGGLTFRSITAGGRYTCGVTTAAAAYCWGSNTHMQLGTGAQGPDRCVVGVEEFPCSTAPVAVAGGLAFSQLAAYAGTDGVHGSTCGVSTGAAYCWGDNIWGVTSGAVSSNQPTQVASGLTVKAVTPGTLHTCALAMDGAAFCWGNNWWGQLGDGTAFNWRSVATPVSGGLTFKAITANTGNQSTCGVTTTGEAYCWGVTYVETTPPVAMCGTGDPDDGSAPCSYVPLQLAGGHRFKSLALGWVSPTGCGITIEGASLCWSADYSSRRPRALSTLSGNLTFASVTVGGLGTACGVTTTGVAYCWGNNTRGELGDGSVDGYTRVDPVKVAGQP